MIVSVGRDNAGSVKHETMIPITQLFYYQSVVDSINIKSSGSSIVVGQSAREFSPNIPYRIAEKRADIPAIIMNA